MDICVKDTTCVSITRTQRQFAFLLLILLLVLTSCAPAPRVHTRSGVSIRQFSKIAVMPYENLTNDRFAGKKIQNLMVMEIMRFQSEAKNETRVDVVEPGEVSKVLKGSEFVSANALDIENIKSIGKQLGVPAIIVGSVHAFAMARGVTISYPEVTINCLLLDTGTGAILASAQTTAGGASFWSRHFKAEGATLDETAQKATKTLVRSLFLQ